MNSKIEERTVKEVLGRISPIIFSIGLIYTISWSHAYTFLDRLGAGWYLNNINLLGMLTIARYSFMAILVMSYLLYFNISATLNKGLIGRAFVWVATICVLFLMAQTPYLDKRSINEFGIQFNTSIVIFTIFSFAAIIFTVLAFHNYRKGIISMALLYSVVPLMAIVIVLPGTFGGVDARRWLERERKGQSIILTSKEKKEYSLIYYTAGEALVLDLISKNLLLIKSDDIQEVSNGR